MGTKAQLLVDQSEKTRAFLEKDRRLLLWSGWNEGENTISLPRYLASQLVAIRTEHARWAYEEGERIACHFALDDRLSLWWLSLLYERHPKMTPNLYTIYRLLALERYLEAEGIDDLLVLGADATLSSVLKEFCRASGRAFTACAPKKAPKKESRLRQVDTLLPPGMRAILRLLVWLVTIRMRAGKAKIRKTDDTTATIATYFPNIDDALARTGRFRSRYFEDLHTVLASLGKPALRWLFIRFPSPVYSFKDCIRLKDTFQKNGQDGLSFTFLEECITGKDIRTSLATFMRIRAKAKELEAHIQEHATLTGSHMPFFPYIKEDYRESFMGWRGLERILHYQGIKNFVAATGPQLWTLFPLENCPWERMLTIAAHAAHGGPVIGAQHSSIRPTDFRYFDDPRVFGESGIPVPDRILANGTSAYKQWKAAGVPEDRLRMVEALRYQYLAQARRQEKKVRPTAVLIATSFFRDETAAHMALFMEAIRHGAFSGYTVILKPHPYLALDEFLPKPLPAGVTFGTKPTAAYLEENVLVWTSNSTTLALEAAILGLPLAVMQPADDFDLCPIQDIPGLVRTATLADVRAMLASPSAVTVPKNYLLLNPALPAWKACLLDI